MECPGDATFHLLVAGQLTGEQRGRVADHAATCAACHAVIDGLMTQHGEVPAVRTGALAVGSVISDKFRIDQVLGVGGMGFVVAATHLELGNRVAIKLMREEMLSSPAIVERFVREARTVAKLRTEHVCKVLDVARLAQGAPYIVMELLEGVDLARSIAARPLAVTVAVEYVLQACVALAEAHAVGLVHRDLKPANLFVTRRLDGGPLVKVLDFGIAKAIYERDASLTRTLDMMGSPGYMSPEQLESARDVDARTDIWALGVTLYQLLSGRVPFAAANATVSAIKIAVEPPAPLEVDPALRAAIFRCLEKAPARRYPDVVALARDLVPFGGPSAAHIARTVAMVAHRSVTLPTPRLAQAPPAVVVSRDAPTAASVMPVDSEVRLIVPRRRWPVLVGAALAAMIIVGIVLVSRRGARAPVVPPIAVAQVAPDAAIAAPDAASQAADRWAASAGSAASHAAGRRRDDAAAPSDKRKDRKGARAPSKPVALDDVVAESNRQMRAMCVEMIKPQNADAAMPLMLAMCWCRLGYATQARAAYAKLTPASRKNIRQLCASNGVSLP